MSLHVYNTLTQAKEEFKPIKEGNVGMYVCGPTVYGPCHVGHARAYVNFDVIYRYLKFKGNEVTYVRNYTDVDDKIIKRAGEEGVGSEEIAAKFSAEFDADMEALGILKPTHAPRVTEHMGEIVNLVSGLVEGEHAYESGGDVFFSVSSFHGYGKLSNRDQDSMIAGARVDINELKRDPLDFVVWKSAKPGEPSWDSPWGKGRPGWHIECSAMSMKYLNETFDIHGGGSDLIFPHHENEIAQSEALTGKTFANYWLHNGHVNLKGEKMSKSLGNIRSIGEVLKLYPAEALRMWIITVHYRSPIDFTENALNDAKDHVVKFYETLQKADEVASGAEPGLPDGDMDDSGEHLANILQKAEEKFVEAMDDDFNTALAMANLFDLPKALNRFLAEKERTLDEERSMSATAAETLRKLGGVLGLFVSEPAGFLDSVKQSSLEKLSISEDEIGKLITERTAARKSKDFARSDAIRDELAGHGITLEDTPTGTIWRP